MECVWLAEATYKPLLFKIYEARNVRRWLRVVSSACALGPALRSRQRLHRSLQKVVVVKYSVLIPTRNGGPFLKNVMSSVLDQDYSDLELIISDNANIDDTAQIVASFAGDNRVKSLRLNDCVPVTDNWNNAFRASAGEYILMLGDDDYLLPGYFTWMDALLDRHSNPDCVLHNAWSYVAPGSISGDPRSYYNESHFCFSKEMQIEMPISRSMRTKLVRDMFHWKIGIPLNMQTALISRRASRLVEGGFFQPPFPDHYALSSLLLGAERWVFSPEKPLVVGISPKSFGHFVYSNHQSDGLAYLGIDVGFSGELPGNPLINGIYVWLEMLRSRYPAELSGVKVDRSGYVRRQFFAWAMQLRLGTLAWAGFLANLRLLGIRDWLGLCLSVFDPASWQRLLRRNSGASAAEAQLHGLKSLDDVDNIQAFAAWLARYRLT